MDERVLRHHQGKPSRFLNHITEYAFANACAARAGEEGSEEEFGREGEGFEILLQGAMGCFFDRLFYYRDSDHSLPRILLICSAFLVDSFEARVSHRWARFTFAGGVEKGVLSARFGVGFGYLHGSSADVESAPGIA